MLSDPNGGPGRFEPTSIKPDEPCSRYRARPESRQMRNRRRGRNKGMNVKVVPIIGYDSWLCMFSYYHINPGSINKTDGSASSEDGSSIESLKYAMAMMLYFASTYQSAMDIIYQRHSKQPPDGIITAVIMIFVVADASHSKQSLHVDILCTTSPSNNKSKNDSDVATDPLQQLCTIEPSI